MTFTRIVRHEEFTASKTRSRFVDVTFHYDDGTSWSGCFPVFYEEMGIDFSDQEITEKLRDAYDQVNPTNRDKLFESARNRWPKKKSTETFSVFEKLLTGNWECRGCGVGKINDQPPARIRDIKKSGYVVATKTLGCKSCGKRTYHDLLLPFTIESRPRSEFRRHLSEATTDRIINVLQSTDIFFNVKRPKAELLIDHKFPSQRWTEIESDNDLLSDEGVRQKFQLLTNQTNMMKSRACDACCDSGERPSFLGIHWFYSGDKTWDRSVQNYGRGCYGCPWFDIDIWRQSINKALND